MSMFSSMGSNAIGGMVDANAKMPTTIISPWSQGLHPNTSEQTGELPRFFYKLMIGNEYERSTALQWSSPQFLDDAAKFVQDDQLKKEIYKEIRGRIFNQHNGSVIIREVTGFFQFAKQIVLYMVATVKMYTNA